MLWIRIGDNDDYHHENDLSDVAERLATFGIGHAKRHNKYGINASSMTFMGQDYISLFWGDREAQPTRGLTTAELSELNSQLRKVSA